jgi:sensor histidine kinase YesM
LATAWLDTFNAFIEDTCVVGTVAYGLTRTRALGAFFEGSTPEGRTVLGLIFGLLASTEVIFPGARSPYVFHTLIICLAQFAGGAEVSLPAVLTVFGAGLVLRGPNEAIQTLIVLIAVVLISELVRRWWRIKPAILVVGLCGGLSQLLAFSVRNLALPFIGANPLAPYSPGSILANTFGLLLVMAIWQDSQTRHKSEQNRLEAEHAQTLLVAADLAALRARIRPHFIFNTLTAIAALCDIDPQRAQTAVVKVSQLMRRHIEIDATVLSTVEKEIEYVRTYVEIQQVRFGKKAAVRFDFDEGVGGARIPAFSLQTLVENAFQHGLEKRSGQGSIRISIRRRSANILCAVMDDGAGMTAQQLRACLPEEAIPKHGLVIIDMELRALFGGKSRLRVLSLPGRGTTAAFRVPA